MSETRSAIEGNTALMRSLRDRWNDASMTHDRMVTWLMGARAASTGDVAEEITTLWEIQMILAYGDHGVVRRRAHNKQEPI